jgi:mono/diheme cytochrome c family protein
MFLAFPHQQAEAPVAPAAALPAIPTDAAKMVNPVKLTPETRAHARKMYGWDCAVCHGEAGDGKGDLGAKYKMKDWTDAASLKDMTDGELFYIIKNGRGQMPAEGDRVKPDDVWALVVLVRDYAKKQGAPGAGR